jgi:hypothetical protein
MEERSQKPFIAKTDLFLKYGGFRVRIHKKTNLQHIRENTEGWGYNTSSRALTW